MEKYILLECHGKWGGKMSQSHWNWSLDVCRLWLWQSPSLNWQWVRYYYAAWMSQPYQNGNIQFMVKSTNVSWKVMEFVLKFLWEPCLYLIHIKINCRWTVRLTFENTHRKISPDHCKQDYINDIVLNIMEPILSL